MKARTGTLLLVAAALVSLAAPAHANEMVTRDEVAAIVKEELGSGGTLRAYWKNGLRLDNADKSIRLKIGGRIMFDVSLYDDDDMIAAGVPATGNTEDGYEFRRVRLYNAGLIADHVKYKLQLDFAGGDANFRDVYIGLTNLGDCLGCAFPDVRVGHGFQPVGLESHTSSKYITFTERSMATNAFTPARKTGLLFHDDWMGDTAGWSAGLFSPTSDSFGDGDFDDGWGASARLWWVPWQECDCECKRLQIGASAMYQDDLKGKRFRARPPTHLTSRFVDTGTIADVQSYLTYAFEAAFVYGPLSLQGEYFIANVDSVSAGDPSFSGWYAMASWWLTGECRAFKHGVPTRVKPCCGFLDDDCCCTGAWELAVRYGTLDLRDSGIDGGESTALTVGVNWHLNANTRVMLNWFTAEHTGTPAGFDPDGAGGVAAGTTTFNDTTLSGFNLRFQVDF